jgi:hypothetical protein
VIASARGIADVMQPCRSDQDLPLVSGEHGEGDPAGLLGDRLGTCAQRLPSGPRRPSAWLLAHWTNDDMRQRYLAANCAR